MVYERMFILIKTHWAKKDISIQVKIRKERDLVCDYGATASNQLTINPNKRKNDLSGILTHIHHCLPGLMLYQCCHLVSCLKAKDLELRSTREACASYGGEDSSLA